MILQSIELREGDELFGVGTVTEVARRKDWVRLTVQQPEGAICFDVPSTLAVGTDRQQPVTQEPKWDQPKGPNPKPKLPSPVPVTPSHRKVSTSAQSSATGADTAHPAT